MWRKEFPFLKLSWLTIKQQLCSEKIAKSIVIILLLHFLCAWFWTVIIYFVFRLAYIYPWSDFSAFVWVTLHLNITENINTTVLQLLFSFFPNKAFYFFIFVAIVCPPLPTLDCISISSLSPCSPASLFFCCVHFHIAVGCQTVFLHILLLLS